MRTAQFFVIQIQHLLSSRALLVIFYFTFMNYTNLKYYVGIALVAIFYYLFKAYRIYLAVFHEGGTSVLFTHTHTLTIAHS